VLSERVAESGGNPLGLLELPALGEAALPVEPLRIGKRLEQAFAQRVAMVPPSARQAMLLVAAGVSAVDVLVRALDLYELSPADLEPAEIAGLLVSAQGRYASITRLSVRPFINRPCWRASISDVA
jgi:hypothetical protein